jgi:hypothetical protein
VQRILTITAAICCLGGVLGGSAAAKPTHNTSGEVVVARGQALQIAVAVDDTGLGAFFGPSVRDAVQMAIERRPRLRGFVIQVNAFNAPCGGGSAQSLADNAATATAVVSDTRNVAVIGHPCSPEAPAWLPTYETAGLATINGSTTGAFIAPLGATVFNATTIPDPAFTDGIRRSDLPATCAGGAASKPPARRRATSPISTTTPPTCSSRRSARRPASITTTTS